MRLERISLRDFRCYETAELAPAPGLTAVLGHNATGKTTLLEAVAWLAQARSFRGAPDTAVVREGTDRAIVRGQVERRGRERLVEAEIARSGRNRIQVDRQAVPRSSALSETLQVTIFSPDDLELVKGGPAGRRRFLDSLLGALAPRLAAVSAEYEKVVRQRTALLRAGLRDADDRATLEVWDTQLVEKGAELVRGRLRLLERLHGPLTKAYGEVAADSTSAGAAVVDGEYEASWFEGALTREHEDDLAGALEAAIERHARRERERGQTLVGPHRDDWRLRIGGLDVRLHASQGEQRSLALALRLAGHAVATEVVGEPPLLLLDDVFSELDGRRTEALVTHLPAGQTLVTTTSELPEELPVEATVRVRERGELST